MPAAEWEPVEEGRIYLVDGDMIASVREQIPDDVDPDGDDPKAWEIGDAAADEAACRAELVAFLVNHRATFLAVAKAAVEMRGTLAEYMENDDHVYENCEELSYGADDCPLCQSERALAAFDSLASGAAEGEK